MISIELFRPTFDEQEIEEVKKTIESKWWGLGKKTEEFEKKFAEYIGAKYAVGVNSCTSALQLAIRVLNLPKEFTFIVPSISFIATAFAPMYEAYKIAFADIDGNDLMISKDSVEKVISDWNLDSSKVAVIPVHLYGNMKEPFIDCTKNDFIGIEDCAHACGSSYNNKKAGTFGLMGCFSFHAVKNLACGDGGMVTTDSPLLYKQLKELRWFGINKSTSERSGEDNLKINYGWEYEIDEIGYKMHMNDLQAALGLVQLARLDETNTRRREIAEIYNREFQKYENWLRIPIVNDNVCSAQHIYAIRTEHRDKLNLYLKEKGIATGVHYKPMYHYKWAGLLKERFASLCPITEREWVKLLSLPCYPSLTELEQEYIIAKVKDFGRTL